jgi:phosphate-selective porin OprO/OprP
MVRSETYFSEGKGIRMKILMAAFVLLGASRWALASQETDAVRLRKLEEQVRRQQSALDGLKQAPPASPTAGDTKQDVPPAAKPADEFPIEAYWKDGLKFRTKDGNFQAHIGGRVILHGRTVFDRPDDSAAPLRTVPDSLFFRETYLEAEGTVYKEFGFKVQSDFRTGTFNQSSGAGPSSTQGNLKDAYIRWQRWPELRVRLGQFYEPVSQEDQTSFRFIDFAERSVMNRLMVGREIGVEFSGKIEDGLLAYGLMFANGNSLLGDQGRAVTDREDEKQIAGRLLVKPFVGSESMWLKELQLGVGGTFEDVDSVPATGFDLTTELSALYLDTTAPGTFDGRRTRIVPQLSWAIGPALLRAEYLTRRDELDETFPDEELRSNGWYAYGTWLLTGESKKPETRVAPSGDWGALELAFRVSRVRISHPFSKGLAGSAGNSDEVTSVTAGVNWWLRRNLRFTLNVVHESFDQDLEFNNRTEDSLVGLIARAQIDF